MDSTQERHDRDNVREQPQRAEVPDLGEVAQQLEAALDQAGVATEITSALGVLLRTVGGVAGDGDVGQDTGIGDSEVIESTQSLHAWLDAAAVAATARLYAVMSERFRPHGPEEDLSKTERRRWRRDARKAVQTEIETTTGRGPRAARQLLDLATAPSHARETISTSLADGAADAYRAWRVVQATEVLPDADRAAIAGSVLPRRPDGTRRSQASFTKSLQRAVTRHLSAAPELARKRDQKALDDRDSTAQVQDDGTGQVRTTGGVERVVAAHARIEAIARAAQRCGNDPRTLAQLRSDVALDLLQFGTIPPAADADEEHHEPNHRDARTAAAGAGTSLRYRDLGELPPARVDIVVSLETLLGHQNGVADIPGWSTIGAHRARAAAVSHGSVWARLVTDPLGHLIEKSTKSYRPTPDIRSQVVARDGTCRFPECQRAAFRCQCDHIVPWAPDGERGHTEHCNLQSLCEVHHDAKTRAIWAALMTDTGDIRWTSPTGREYTSSPQDWAAATAASPDGADGAYRWLRDQLDKVKNGEDHELEPIEIGSALQRSAGPDGRRVQEGSEAESYFAAVVGDWWQNTRSALAGLEVWHHTPSRKPRRGPAPQRDDHDEHSTVMPDPDDHAPLFHIARLDLDVELEATTSSERAAQC